MWTAVIAGAAAGLASVPHCTAMCGPLAAYACSGAARSVRSGALPTGQVPQLLGGGRRRRHGGGRDRNEPCQGRGAAHC